MILSGIVLDIRTLRKLWASASFCYFGLNSWIRRWLPAHPFLNQIQSQQNPELSGPGLRPNSVSYLIKHPFLPEPVNALCLKICLIKLLTFKGIERKEPRFTFQSIIPKNKETRSEKEQISPCLKPQLRGVPRCRKPGWVSSEKGFFRLINPEAFFLCDKVRNDVILQSYY